MKTIVIDISEKIAISPADEIVCGNSDYCIRFNFDDEWSEHVKKTARFLYGGKCEDVIFEGDTVRVPIIKKALMLSVGVYAGELSTTTPAMIKARKSILCDDGLPPDPTPDVYAQLVKMTQSAEDTANKVLKMAENGDFNGEDAKITDVTAAVDDRVGTPSVDVELGGDEVNRSFHFDFHKLRGKDAEIDGVSASVDDEVGTPEVDVEVSGEPTKRSLKFNFRKMKGNPGKDAKIKNVTASVNNNSGTPQVNVTMGGTETERSFNFDFLNLKGKPFTYEDFTPEQLEELKGGGLAKYATEVIDDTAVMIKNTPETTAPYAEVKEIGGMTHKVNVGTEDAPVYELHNAPVTNVESIGVNLFDKSKILYGSIDSNGDLYLPSGQKRFYEGNFKKNTQYTFRAYCRTVNGGAVRLVCNYTDGSKDEFFTVYGSDTEYVGKKFVSDADKTISHISVNYGSSGGDLYIEGGELMINEGTEALPYEPFVRHTLPIPEAIRNLDGYGWGINADCYNYVDLVNKQFVKRVGCVDMGTLKWSLKGSNTLYFAASVSDRPAGVGLVLCAPYDYDSTGLHKNNLTISTNWKTVKNAVNVRDDNYTDAETFKASMSGVMLYYELETPVITDISDLLPADDLIRVEENGTVTMVNEQGYDMPNRIVFYKAVNKAVASEIFVGDLTGKAQRAIGDENGNNIMKTYATKEELAEMLATIMSLIEGGNNT